MHFAKDVYVSQDLIDNKDKILNSMKYGKGFYNYYLIYKSNSGNYECMKSLYFRQKAFADIPFLIEGVVSKKGEALEYMARKTAEVMDVIYDA